jgi:hypothetical protein
MGRSGAQTLFRPDRARCDLQVPGSLRLRVDDKGHGTPDHYREKVFDKFFALQRPDTGKKAPAQALTSSGRLRPSTAGISSWKTCPKGAARRVEPAGVTGERKKKGLSQ